MHGALLGVQSSKGISPGEIVSAVRGFGEPVVVATDKAPLPDTVRRVASAFDARVYVPQQSLSREEKNGLVRGCATSSNHEADALAAALKAYSVFSAKFRQIEKQEGPDFERNVKQRLLGARVEKQPAVVVAEREVLVEKPVEKYEARLGEMRRQLQRLEQALDNERNITRMQRQRIAELESPAAGLLSQSAATRAAAEKARLEETLNEFASAFRRGELRLAKAGEAITDDRAFFDKCRQEGRECTLVKILYNDGHVYYVPLEHFVPEKPLSLTDIVEDYRRKRK
jgi:predicted RNase H-like nuclease (RuvC/YqgF family)